MRSLRKLPIWAVVLIVVPSFGAGLAVSAAASTTSSSIFYACLKSGSLSDVSTSSQSCASGYQPVTWSATGPQGAAGPQGVAGPKGAAGPQGAAGPRGIAGPQGVAGARGAVGPQGAAGSRGTEGAQGVAGPRGAVGPRGVIGPQGPGAITATGHFLTSCLPEPSGCVGGDFGAVSLALGKGTYVLEVSGGSSGSDVPDFIVSVTGSNSAMVSGTTSGGGIVNRLLSPVIVSVDGANDPVTVVIDADSGNDFAVTAIPTTMQS